MCGFVALVARNGPPPETAALERMRDALAHRGPDDATLELIDEWCGFGFRRLSIIDVEGSRQPLRNETGEIVCVFNGEIYNFADLRHRLIALGHRFATSGDGEVIVHGYEEWGTGVFSKLEGMFAIGLIDRKERRVLFARDRFGIKPAFYTYDAHRLAVASEIKALLADPTQRRSASHEGLVLGTVRMHVPWPLTAFAGIYRLPPGAFLELVQGREPRLERFAFLDVGNRKRTTSPEEAAEILRAAVARQMVADVPVGAFLSGGIDSTLIVSLMREVSSAELHTFSVRTSRDDESAAAAETARLLGTTHHVIDLDDIRFEDLAELPRLFDEPFAETSAIGVRALSRLARQHVKVALSGDGGDEIFAGYGSYRWIRTAGHVGPLMRPFGSAWRHMLQRGAWPPIIRQALRAALLVSEPPETAQRDLSTLSFAAIESARLSSEALSERIAQHTLNGTEKREPIRRAMIADQLERLPNAMLTKVDIAAMSASLEVRVPLLDDRVVHYAKDLATRELVGGRWGKLVLRRVLEREGGARLAWKKKRGFTLPLDRWMDNPTNATRIEQVVNDHGATLRSLTNQDAPRLWSSFTSHQTRLSRGTTAMQLLWLVSVALWAEYFGVHTASTDEATPIT